MSLANKIVVGLVGLTVMAVIFSAMLPIMGDVTSAEDTFKNEGYFYLDEFTDNYTFKWDYDDPTTFVINGEEVTFVNQSGLTISVVLGEKFAIRYGDTGLLCNFYGMGTFITANATNKVMTASLSSGSFTVSNGATSKTVTDVSNLYSIVDKGDYVMKDSSKIAYLNEDSDIYASGQTYNGGAYIFWHLEGVPAVDTGILWPDDFDSGLTVSNKNVNIEENSNHIDLYELTNLTFTAVKSDVTYNVTASYFVVPAEVTAERSIHPDGPTTAILNMLPLIVGAGLVLGAIAFMIVKRK